MGKLDEIVTVNIDIAAPAMDQANFDNLLIFGPPPMVAPERPIRPIGRYSDLSELTDAGFVAFGDNADPIGIAARIAFSQNPKPPHIYVAPMLDTPMLITNAVPKIISAANVATEGIPVGTITDIPHDLPWLQVAYSRQEVAQMFVEVEKDDVLVFGQALTTTAANPDAYFQIAIGTTDNPTSMAMNLPPEEWAGVFNVTLTAIDTDGRETILARNIEFNGTNRYYQRGGITLFKPLATDITDVLDNALAVNGWYVVCEAGIDESLYGTAADWTEAQTKQFAYTFLQETDPVDAIYFRSQGWCGLITDHDLPEDVPSANAYLHVAAVARCLSFPTGSETWAFKRLAAVLPAEISSTLRKNLMDGHSNFFSQYAGRNITMNGQVRGGEWIDVIRGRDWLQNDMQLRIFSLMLMRPKIPYTNSGIALVETQMIASLKAATDRGIVAPDEWDEDGNLIPGFVVRVPNSQSMTATQRAARILEGCKFTARIAGAIHVVRVDGVLTYEGGETFGSDI